MQRVDRTLDGNRRDHGRRHIRTTRTLSRARDRFRIRGETDTEQTSVGRRPRRPAQPARVAPSEAPTGFDNLTNGFSPQGPPSIRSTRTTSCHCSPSTTTASFSKKSKRRPTGLARRTTRRVAGSAIRMSDWRCEPNRRASHRPSRPVGRFLRVARRLAHSFARNASDIVEHVAFEDDVQHLPHLDQSSGRRVHRMHRKRNPDGNPGCSACWVARNGRMVPVLEANELPASVASAGRASTRASSHSPPTRISTKWASPVRSFRTETLRAGSRFGSPFDPVEDPEDDGVDIVAFANFMRSTKAPSRGPITPRRQAGEDFSTGGLRSCHVSTLRTPRPGTRINGDVFTVPDALGNKIIHPYSDFLLHDVGTGDGIPVLPTPESRDHQPDTHGAAVGAEDA